MTSVGGLALLVVVPGLAHAEAPSTPASKVDGAPPVEEIVVTADRKNTFSADYVQAGSFRGARQIDTPLTVSVIPQQLIQSQQALSILDALRNTAGVTQSQTSPIVYNNLSIRGIAVDNRANYRLDGVLPIVNLIDLPLEDKDRIEALKGASALYYGFTTPSGIINMTMKRPRTQPYLEIDAFGNRYGALAGHVDASETVGMFGVRLNGLYGSVDSGIRYTHGHRGLLAAAFDFRPTDKLLLTLDVEHIEKSVVEPGVFRPSAPVSTVNNLYPALGLPPLLDPRTNIGPSWAKNYATETNVLASANYKFDNTWNLELDAGDSRAIRNRHFNTFIPTNLSTGDGLTNLGMQRTVDENKNLRAQVSGAFYTGPFAHEVLVGTSYNLKDQYSPPSVIANCLGGVAPAVPLSCANNFYHLKVFPETPFPYHVVADTTRITDIGYYAFDRIKYGQWLQLLGGIRYSNYVESDVTTNKDTFKATPVSYSAGVVLKPRPWASVYATYIEGLESTPSAPAIALNAGAQLPATTSTQYEGGIKLEPRRGLLFQAAYFNIDRAATYVNGAGIYVQDGRAVYKGFEMSLTGEISPSLSIYASAQLLDAKTASGAATTYTYTNGTSSTVLNPALKIKSIAPTLVGKVIENTPRVTLSVAGEYHLEHVPGLTLTGGVYYVGKRAINGLNEAFIPGYTLVDLGASYTAELLKHSTTFRINAENVGHVRYWASTGSLLLAEGAPANVKVSVMTRF